MVVVVCCNYIFGGTEGVSMSMCADWWLLRVLGLVRLREGAAAIKCSSCSTRCMIAARLLGEGSAECCATAGLHKFVLV